MTSGIQNNPNAGAEIYPSPDFVQLALAAELSSKPGEVWSYNNKALNLMAGIIKKVTRQRMDVYIGERLFKPLEIVDFTWSLDSAGNPHVMSGCQIKPKDFIKIGLLLLNKGKFNGTQIISTADVEKLIIPCEQYKGYGLLWWLDYDQSVSVVDDEIISTLKSGGVAEEFIEKAIKAKGIYKSDEEYMGKIVEIFGANPWYYISSTLAQKNLRLRKKEFQGSITYQANGYLGNYIVVDPKSKIVAVRMISHKSFKNEKDGFDDFKSRVLSLTQ
jgi:CubicO group peptidase (beta-lactamase class C family)